MPRGRSPRRIRWSCTTENPNPIPATRHNTAPTATIFHSGSCSSPAMSTPMLAASAQAHGLVLHISPMTTTRPASGRSQPRSSPSNRRMRTTSRAPNPASSGIQENPENGQSSRNAASSPNPTAARGVLTNRRHSNGRFGARRLRRVPAGPGPRDRGCALGGRRTFRGRGGAGRRKPRRRVCRALVHRRARVRVPRVAEGRSTTSPGRGRVARPLCGCRRRASAWPRTGSCGPCRARGARGGRCRPRCRTRRRCAGPPARGR